MDCTGISPTDFVEILCEHGKFVNFIKNMPEKVDLALKSMEFLKFWQKQCFEIFKAWRIRKMAKNHEFERMNAAVSTRMSMVKMKKAKKP